MSRYVRPPAKGRLYVEDHIFADEGPFLPGISVSEHESVNTGLLWADGSAVMRVPNPIGFGKDDQW